MKTLYLIASILAGAEAAHKGRSLVRATRVDAKGAMASVRQHAHLSEDDSELAHEADAQMAASMLDRSLSRKGHGHHSHNVNCKGSWTNPGCSNCATVQKEYRITQNKVGDGKACEASNGARQDVQCSCSCEGHWETSACTSCTNTEDVYVILRHASNGGAECPEKSGAKKERTCSCTDCMGSWELSDPGVGGACEDCGKKFTYNVKQKVGGHGKECPFQDKAEKADCIGYWPNTKTDFRCKKENNCGKEEITFVVDVKEKGPGGVDGMGECRNRDKTKIVDCDESNQSCDQDCEGDWVVEDCAGKCGQHVVDRFKVTSPRRGTGKECLESDGATRTKECPCSPEDCKGNWDFTDKEAKCTKEKCTAVQAGAVAAISFEKTFHLERKEQGTGMPCEAEDGDKVTEDCPCGSMIIAIQGGGSTMVAAVGSPLLFLLTQI